MHTIYDWCSVGLFCALAVLFLQRSVGPAVPGDRIWHYLPPALGCAVGNVLGNAGQNVAGVAVLLVSVGYIVRVLKPGLAGR